MIINQQMSANMKTILYLSLIFLISTSFVRNQPKEKHTQKYSIDGTWELVNRFNYDGENITDTIPDPDGYRQIKMYNNGKVMWTRFVPQNSVEWFAYGSYSVSEGNTILRETLEYGSASMMKVIDTMRVFSFELYLEKDHYKQFTVDEDGNRIFSENYKRIR